MTTMDNLQLKPMSLTVITQAIGAILERRLPAERLGQ
jgi:hypothetical protein